MGDYFARTLRSDGSRNRHTPLSKALTTPDEKSMRNELSGGASSSGRIKAHRQSPLDFRARLSDKKYSPLGSASKRLQRSESKDDSTAATSPRAASVVSADESCILTEDIDSMSNDSDSVQVIVRIRPPNETETADEGHYNCLNIIGTREVQLNLKDHEPKHYTYDQVLEQAASQEEVFTVAGMPVVENCLAGYNSSIFAYGQTGSGKTHTVLGALGTTELEDLRGLAPRVFEYLFKLIKEEEDSKGRDRVRYSCICSFLEIYNEIITDLLHPDATRLEIRESSKTGCYVEGLSQHTVLTVEEVLRLMQKGASSRHVGETRLNRESSRSHSVFTCIIEKTTVSENGLKNVISSRLNLIDLAGSERVKSGAFGGSHVQGEHFKETCHINSSLTTLGRVIRELVEAQKRGRKGHHIPYRESRLTFLLQDSLGGNAKTMIIANVSPSAICYHETASTLSFAVRAKCMRNKAHINVDTQGDKILLQKEIQRLNTELDMLRKGQADPAIAENKELRERIAVLDQAHEELQRQHMSLQASEKQAHRGREAAEAKMAGMVHDISNLQDKCARLSKERDDTEAATSKEASRREAQQAAELRKAVLARQQAEDLVEKERAATATARKEADEMKAELQALQQVLQGSLERHRSDISGLSEKLLVTKQQLLEAQQQASSAQATEQLLKEQVQQLTEEASCLRAEQETAVAAGQVLQSQLLDAHAAKLQVEEAAEQAAAELQQKLDAATEQLLQQNEAMAELTAVYESLRQKHAKVVRKLEQESSSREQADSTGRELQLFVEQLQLQLKQEQLQHNDSRQLVEHLQQQISQQLERVAALDGALSATTSALQQHKEQVHDLQAQLADEQELLAGIGAAKAEGEAQLAGTIAALEQKVADLSDELRTSRAVLQREQQEHNSTQHDLDDVCQQLAGVQRELADVQQAQAEADALSLRLQNQLQKANSSLQAKEHEVTKLMQELSTTSQLLEQQQQHSLCQQQELDDRQCEIADRQQELGARQHDLQALQEQLRKEQQQLASAQEQLRGETEQRGQVELQVQELLLQVQQLQQQLFRNEADYSSKAAALASQLSSEQAGHSSTHQALQQAQQLAQQLHDQLAAQEQLHSEHVVASTQQQERASSMMAQQQEQIASLRTQLHEAQERHAAVEVDLTARVEEVETQLSCLCKEKAVLLSDISCKEADLEVLSSRLQDMTHQADNLQHRLEQEVNSHSLSRSNADSMQQSLEQQLEQLRRAYDKLKTDFTLRDRDQQAQINDLHMQVLSEQEAKGALGSELRKKLTDQSKELELLRKAHASLLASSHTQQLELDRTRASLAEEREARSRAEGLAQEKERHINQLRKAVHDTSNTLEKEKCSLKKEQQQLQEQLEDKESVLKNELVRQARHQRAFGEIRRLIDWATTPPSSMRSSLGGSIDGAPTSELTSPVTSPRPRLRRFNTVYGNNAPNSAPPEFRASLETMRKSPEPNGRTIGYLTPHDRDTLRPDLGWTVNLGAQMGHDASDLSASFDQVL